MPTSLADLLTSIQDAGSNTAAEMRNVITALYDWIPPTEKYRLARLPGETAHSADDFFASYAGYTEQAPSGTATWAATRGGLGCKFNSVASSNVAVAVKAIPAAGVPITIETRLSMAIDGTSNPSAGIVFTSGTAVGSNFAGFGIMTASGGATGWTTPSGTLNGATSGINGAGVGTWMMGPGTFIRLIWSAANVFEVAVSPDGQLWVDFALTTFSRTFTPTHMGFYVTNWTAGAAVQAVTFDYLRVYEADLSV